MIWLKRLVPFILIAAMIWGYYYYRGKQKEEIIETSKEHALVTAKVWYASARFKDEPEKFENYRDTVLAEAGLSKEQMYQFLEIYKKVPVNYEVFAHWVSYYVDSLYEIGQSIDKEKGYKQDSVGVKE
ncbi:MAG: hypothetical protein ABIJ12_00950 [bacterium]